MSCSPYGLHLQKYKKISIIERNKLILTLLYSRPLPKGTQNLQKKAQKGADWEKS